VHIPVKAGRLATGAYKENSPISGNVFRRSKDQRLTPATVGGIEMPRNRQSTVYGNPIADNYNTATQVDVAARTPVGYLLIKHTQAVKPASPTEFVPMVQPHEKGSTLKKKLIPVDKRQFGGGTDNQADTAFHLHPEKNLPRPTPVSAVAGEKTKAASFFTFSNLWRDPNNSFYQGVISPGTGRVGVGRWDTTKTGVV
jgi:hypothetical protein